MIGIQVSQDCGVDKGDIIRAKDGEWLVLRAGALRLGLRSRFVQGDRDEQQSSGLGFDLWQASGEKKAEDSWVARGG